MNAAKRSWGPAGMYAGPGQDAAGSVPFLAARREIVLYKKGFL